VGPGTDGSSKIHRNKNPFMAAFSMPVFQDGPELADSWYNSVLLRRANEKQRRAGTSLY